MKFFKSCVIASISASRLFSNVLAWDPTDSLMDADQAQTGYLPNHNMDPNVVAGGSWGQIWSFYTGVNEQFYAKPLTFTPASTGRQVALMFSEHNNIYSIDMINGTLVNSRSLGSEGEVPFAVSDLGQCNDISDSIGITGTPVIDNVTETIYFWSKSYNTLGGTVTGYANGAYRFHGINAVTLKDVFPPVNIQGTPADNDATKWFTGGTVLQRPSLNIVSGVVLTGFGGHCDQYNYTGWVVGMSAKTGALLTSYATVGGVGTVNDGYFLGRGGGAAIWMGGTMLPSDQAGRIFFVTGNGQNGQNQAQPASGRVHLNTLNEAVVNMAVNATTGKVSQSDYFEPYTYAAMDGGDRDLGAGGVQLLDPNTFQGTGVSRMAVAAGKNGIAYILNADNLGGYKLGVGGTDAVLQTLTMPNSGSIFANSGSYPLEGGYLYITPVGYGTQVFSLGFDNKGAPLFTFVATTPDIFAGRPGIGPPTITTYKGQAGTAILWVADPNTGLRAYYAVPSNGTLTSIPLPPGISSSKYQRPGFGNGRYVMGSSNGYVRGYGSPVQLPLTCTSPLDFGTLPIGQTLTKQVSCTSNININSFNGFALGKSMFTALNSSLPKVTAAAPFPAGKTFSFNVTFDLTSKAGSSAIAPGVQGSAIQILTNNAATGYASQDPISVTGQAISASPFLVMNPLQVNFGGIVVGSSSAAAGTAATFVISNAGLSPMTILGLAYITGSIPAGTAVYNNLTTSANVNGTTTSIFDANGYFSSANLPQVGQIVAPGSSITVSANFNTYNNTGTFSTMLMVYTDGGNAYTIFAGSAASTPVALLQYSNGEGGWITIPHCADVSAGCETNITFAPTTGSISQSIQLQFTNTGGSTLTITKSKPLEGTVLGATNPTTDFAEAMTLAPGKSTFATVSFAPGGSILNADDITYSGVWTLNTDDLTFGVHSVNFIGVLTSKKVGPILANGQAQYRYLGCYKDQTNNGARVESLKTYVNTTGNTNGWCQTNALNAGAVFAGTEYQQECYVGNVIPSPSILYPDSNCGYGCTGDATQTCGGVGGYLSMYYDTTRYFPNNGTILGSSGKGPSIPQTLAGGWNYYGCWSDSTTLRVMTSAISIGAKISLDTCATFCAKYAFFGVEYADECYCGNSINLASQLKADTDCNMICANNTLEYCGAASRLSVYVKNGTVLPSASMPSSTSQSTTTTISTTQSQSTTATMSTAQSQSQSTTATMSTSSTAGAAVATGSFVAMGCYTDSNTRAFGGDATTDTVGMTIEECGAYCQASAQGPFTYFGLEWTQECYCGNALTSSIATDGRCNMPCKGNSQEICGGNWGLSVFSYNGTNVATTTSGSSTASSTATSTSAVATPTIPSIVAGGWSYLHCHSDNTTIRTLVGAYTAPSTMTIENCASFCSGYQYFGVEYYAECYCSNKISYGSTVLPVTSCNYRCKGNSMEYCGGSGALVLYNNTPAAIPVRSTSSSSSTVLSSTYSSTSLSTTSSSSASSLTTTSSSLSSTSSPTSSVSSSSSFTSSSSTTSSSISSGFTSSSTVLSSSSTSSLLSSSTLSSTSVQTTSSSSSTVPPSITTSSSSSSSSTFLSSTSPTSSVSATSSSSSSLIVSSSSTSSSFSSTSSSTSSSRSLTTYTATIATSVTVSSTSTSTSATATASSNPWQYMGCANDTVAARALIGSTYTSATAMTQASCQAYCASVNFPVAGLEYASQCYCGNSLTNKAVLGQTGCTMPCNGASTQMCGGSSRLSVFNNTAYVAPSINKPVVGWAYSGCYTELTTGRALGTLKLTSTTAMTIELCVSTCQKAGLPVAGIEFGSQCFCGTQVSNLSQLVGDSDCAVKLCPGNPQEYCSNGSRLQTYTMVTAGTT